MDVKRVSLSLEVGYSGGCDLGLRSIRVVGGACSCPFATATGPELWPTYGPK